MVVARITFEGISNAQVANEPQSASVNQASEAIAHTGKNDRLIQTQHRPS
jgi:hypothetical protein